MTPRVLEIVFTGAVARLEREHHGRAWLAWHGAALPRVKKFPSLEDLMGIRRQVRRQSPEELAANIKRMFGMK